jgi:hypothetical protein
LGLRRAVVEGDQRSGLQRLERGRNDRAIKDFLRHPALLRERRVVVTIVSSGVVAYDSMWDLPPLPQ